MPYRSAFPCGSKNRREFEYLEQINRSILTLYRALSPERIHARPDEFLLGAVSEEIIRAPIVGTQTLVRRIANYYGLKAAAIVVDFSDIDCPGRVELSDSDDFFVEINNDHRRNPVAIAAILAHEVAHVFLHKARIRFSDRLENEILTDTTAAYLGFGTTIFNAAHVVSGDSADSVTIMSHFGYLTLSEFGYILTKRYSAFGIALKPNFESRVLSAFEVGRKRYLQDQARRPLVPRSLCERAISSMKYKMFKRSNMKVVFACPTCTQMLRVPELAKLITVRCPVCKGTCFCHA